jgi:MFS family permease
VGTVGGAAAIALTLGAPSYGEFLLTLIVFNTLWNFALPFILALAAALTPSGRLISVAIAFQMIGLAFGPLAAGELLGGTASFEPVKLLSIATMVLALALFTWPLLAERRDVRRDRAVTVG